MNSETENQYKNYKDFVNLGIIKFINKEKNPKIREIIKHSLEGGKRLRPILCLLIFKKYINDIPDDKLVTYFCLIPELIHNISLIIDDLPCMDNDDFRRNKETTHFKYGIVASYITILKLINNILLEFKNLVDFDRKFRFKNKEDKIETKYFREFYTSQICDYMSTLIDGQYYDLQFLNIDLDVEVLYRINSKKTSPLFSLSFVLGYLMVVHFKKNFIIEEKILIELKELGEIFGLIFQLNDDIIDREEDLKEGKNLNISLHLGKDKSIKIFYDKCSDFLSKLDSLKLLNDNFKEIILLLKKRISII